jgi:ketosteroid isomerase-like protein
MKDNITRLFGFFALFLALLSSANAQKLLSQKAKQEMLTIFGNQLAAWNRGDLPGFMEGYWNSDSLVFIGSKGLTYGWQTTLANYQRAYPDAEAMGKLSFEFFEMKPLGTKSAMVIGKWQLDRKSDVLKGHFLLVLKRIKKEWKIVADHSS